MKKYTVWFTIFGKSIKVKNFKAENEQDAEYRLRGRIIVDKIEEIKEKPNLSMPDFMKDLFK